MLSIAVSHFRALVKRGEGAKTLRAAISGLPVGILAAEQLIIGLRFAKIGKQNAY